MNSGIRTAGIKAAQQVRPTIGLSGTKLTEKRKSLRTYYLLSDGRITTHKARDIRGTAVCASVRAVDHAEVLDRYEFREGGWWIEEVPRVF